VITVFSYRTWFWCVKYSTLTTPAIFFIFFMCNFHGDSMLLFLSGNLIVCRFTRKRQKRGRTFFKKFVSHKSYILLAETDCGSTTQYTDLPDVVCFTALRKSLWNPICMKRLCEFFETAYLERTHFQEVSNNVLNIYQQKLSSACRPNQVAIFKGIVSRETCINWDQWCLV
jgi:hypothetical protein